MLAGREEVPQIGACTGVLKDDARALLLYQRACDLGLPRGCNNVAARYAAGLGVPKDPSQAVLLYQKACDGGQEDRARGFYTGALGLREIPKPPSLAHRGGVWFSIGDHQQLHLGVESDFQPAIKAHPAFLVRHLPSVLAQCRQAGVIVAEDELLPGYARAYVNDPFGRSRQVPTKQS